MSRQDARHQSLRELHERRREVIRLHLEGHRVMQIVVLTGLSWPSVRRAIDQYLAGGESAIEPAARGKQSGDGRHLGPSQEASICAAICAQRPEQLGFDTALWDRAAVGRLIERELGLVLSVRALGNYILRWGFSPPRPSLRKSDARTPALARWLDERYPHIARQAKRDFAEIHWITEKALASDGSEAGFALSGTVVRFGAASNQGKTRWMIAQTALAADAGIEFLDALARDVGGNVCVIADADFKTIHDPRTQAWLAAQPGARVSVHTRRSAIIDTMNVAHAAPPMVHVAHAPAAGRAARTFDSPATAPQRSRVHFADVSTRSGRRWLRWLASAHGPVTGPLRGITMRLRTTAVAGVVLALAATAAVFTLQPVKKVSMKPMIGDYWAHRVAYPTMHFSPSWYTDAKPQDAAVLSAVPAGERDMLRSSQSPLALSSDAWTFLGPSPLNGGYGITAGRINVIAVDPSGPDIDGLHTVFAASDGGGVWKSTNCCTTATTWRNVTDQPDIASIAIGELYIEPSNPNVIYAGTGDLRYSSFTFGTSGLLKSTDKGETWRVLGESVFTPFYPPSASLGFPQYQAIGKVVSDPHNADTLIVGTKTGLFVSNDGGNAWTGPCYTNPHASQRQDVTGLLARNTGASQTTLIAAIGTRGNPTPVQPDLANLGANGVYRAVLPATGCPSVADWTLLDNGFPAGTGNGDPAGKVLGRLELAASRSDPQVLYAMAAHATANNVLGVWRSNDGGTTWTQRTTSAGIQAGGCSSAGGGGAQMWYDAGITVDPNNAETVLLSGVDVYRSQDGGATFQDMTCGYSNGNVHVDQHARAYLPSGGGNYDSAKVLTGSDGGVYYTANMTFGTGGSSTANRPSFIPLNQTIGTIELYSGDITANFANAVTPGASAGAQDNGSSWARWSASNPGPTPWTERNGGDGIYTRIEPVLENRWYYSSQNGNVVVSQSGPNSSPTAAFPSGWGGDVLSFVMPFEIYRYGALDVAGSGCTSAAGCTYLIAGTNRVWETITGAIPRTSWYANSPNLTKNTLGNRSFVNQLAYAIKTPAIAMAATNDGNVQYGYGLNQGVANSATWVDLTAANAVLPNRPVMDVVFDVGDAANPSATAVGYASLGGFDQNTPAQPGHVYQVSCANHCATFTWRNVSRGLPNIPANAIAINPNLPTQVFVGTDWGVYYTNDADAANPVWYRFDNGLPRVMVWDLAVDRGFSTLAAFTRGRGVWAFPLPTVASDVIFANDFEPF